MPCSGGLRPSLADEQAPSLSSSGIDAHRAPLQHNSAAESLEQELLTRLVALNHARAAEEKRGLIRWLRPDFQAPGTTTAQQVEIGLDDSNHPQSTIHDPQSLPDWPADLPAQVVAIRKLLPSVGQDAEILAACFGRKSKKRVDQVAAILDTLKTLGLII